jgi:hypothetical protein
MVEIKSHIATCDEENCKNEHRSKPGETGMKFRSTLFKGGWWNPEGNVCLCPQCVKLAMMSKK